MALVFYQSYLAKKHVIILHNTIVFLAMLINMAFQQAGTGGLAGLITSMKAVKAFKTRLKESVSGKIANSG